MVYTVDGVKIANLRTVKTLATNEKFPVSQIGTGSKTAPEQSYACRYNDFYNNIVDRDIRASDFTISSNWTFVGGLSVTPHDTNARKRVGRDVATMSYFYNELYIGHFCKLSSDMFGDSSNGFEAKKKPSYIGMVVISHTLNTASKLTAIYGKNTVWEKLGGRFLLTVGMNLANTDKKYGNNTNAGDLTFASAKRMGGTPGVLLTTKNIASHTHTLCENGTALPIGRLPYVEKPLEPELEGGGEFGVCTTPGAAGSPDWGASFAAAGGNVSSAVPGGVSETYHNNEPAYRTKRHTFSTSIRMNTPGTWPSVPISPSEIWGGGVQTKEIWGTFQAKFTVGDMTATCNDKTTFQNVPHNNVPPLIVEYIWERTL